MMIPIKFELVTDGYIDAVFLIDEKPVVIPANSDSSDLFQALLNVLFLLREFVINRDAHFFPFSQQLTWQDCAVAYRWTLSQRTVESDVEIQIERLDEAGAVCAIAVQVAVSWPVLSEAILQSLDAMLTTYGFIGYKNAWGAGNFPVAEYLILKAEKAGIVLANKAENDAPWQMRADLWNELALLQFAEVTRAVIPL